MKAKPHAVRCPFWVVIVAVFFVTLFLTAALPARAQGVPPCLSFTATVEALGQKYHEEPVAVGMVNDGAVVVLFSTAGGETWTLVVRKASGETCFLASGSGWAERLPTPVGKEG